MKLEICARPRGWNPGWLAFVEVTEGDFKARIEDPCIFANEGMALAAARSLLGTLPEEPKLREILGHFQPLLPGAWVVIQCGRLPENGQKI
jgi:hypothetical protein